MRQRGGRMAETALVIMARYPQVGTTKTRLARAIGSEETVRHYQAFIATLTPSLLGRMTCFPQQGADLGERLHHVFRWTQERGFGRTIVISSDSPHIGLASIAHAEQALDEADIVLGPADDGGYYLIAMRQPYDVFSGIPMSTSVVTRLTMEMAHHQGLTVQLIEPLFDVDELPDLVRLAQVLEVDSTLAPATATHLATIKELV